MVAETWGSQHIKEYNLSSVGMVHYDISHEHW